MRGTLTFKITFPKNRWLVKCLQAAQRLQMHRVTQVNGKDDAMMTKTFSSTTTTTKKDITPKSYPAMVIVLALCVLL